MTALTAQPTTNRENRSRIAARLVVIAHRRAREARAHARPQAVFRHQPDHAFAAHPHLLLEQVAVNPRAAVPVLAGVERRVHQHLQPAIRCARADAGRARHA